MKVCMNASAFDELVANVSFQNYVAIDKHRILITYGWIN